MQLNNILRYNKLVVCKIIKNTVSIVLHVVQNFREDISALDSPANVNMNH